MKKIKVKIVSRKILSDIITPVSIYLKIRDLYPGSVLLESSDYHSNHGAFSFIGMDLLSEFRVESGLISVSMPGEGVENYVPEPGNGVIDHLNRYISSFETGPDSVSRMIDGVFGYMSYDAVRHFEDIGLQAADNPQSRIPEIRYGFFRYVIAINHLKNELHLFENIVDGAESSVDTVVTLLQNRNIATYGFSVDGEEQSNMSDAEFMEIVAKGREHCHRGDVFQIVLSRQFTQRFRGDEFNVYRALRSVNPSPYLFYFDYGSYKLFGSSPETQIEVKNGKAYINPIAGTFRRTGDDAQDQELARKLAGDDKENAEHIMLVDLARNDLSRTTTKVTVERYREIQFYSHVIHMVSKVSGELRPGADKIRILAESFPAGTLSGAPKFRAMELIDRYEQQKRGFYGGTIGNIRFNGDINTAIMIRSFLSRDNTLFYQAGAGVVSESTEEGEKNEVNNKLAALKSAIGMAGEI
ncbi:MAG: anthranilate synthase component I family protein [Bacteroidota bacterium]